MLGREIFTKRKASGGVPVDCPSPTTILTQPWDTTSNGWASDSAANQIPNSYAVTADKFSFTHGALITDMHWTGGFDPVSESPQNDFLITFFADSSGSPGSVLQIVTPTTTTGNPVHVGIVGEVDVYTYSTTFVANFIADAGVTYWVSVQNHRTAAPPEWLWLVSGLGNAQQNFFATGFSPTGSSMAYDFTGCVGS